jgi:hypothetical protein
LILAIAVKKILEKQSNLTIYSSQAVTMIMHEVYREDGSTFLAREVQSTLKPQEVMQIVSSQSIQFAFLEINQRIYLHEPEDINSFWEEEVKPKLCKSLAPKVLKKFTKRDTSTYEQFDYCYFASLWESETSEKIIVLSAAH